jgi:beta-galactosidase
MRQFTSIYFSVLCLLSLSPKSSIAQSIARERISMDDNWKFHFGHAANAEKDFNYGIVNIFAKSGTAWGTSATEAKFNDSLWRSVSLPHDWAVELPFSYKDNQDVDSHGYKPVGGLFPETSVGWYRKHFAVAKSDSGSRFQLQFDGIYRDANIWINGFYLGNNKSGYLGTAYDVTDFINFGKENVIAVRADATQYEGWFYEGAGIYRHVWLNKFANLHLHTEGSFAYAKVENDKALITVETPIMNDNNAQNNCTISAYLTDRDGKIIVRSAEEKATINANEEKIYKQLMTVTKPHLWSIEDPYLYRITTEIKQSGKVIDTKTIKFGIRTIDIKPNGVFVNGKYVKLKGVNNHQDHAGVGSALPDALQYYRIDLLKKLGVNAYRTSHNAPTPELLDACDSLGMLVLDEQRLLNSGAEYLNQFERLIKRDRNHPSVFLWSIGNEEGWIHTQSTGKRIAQTLVNKQKQLDPTRTSTYAADVGNVFNGVNEVIPVRGFNYRQMFVADYHKDHPNQPIIGTEMGSTVTTRGIYEKDTVRCYVPDQDITAPWWASTAETWWQLAANNDFWLGGFVWTGFDYRGEPTPYKYPNINSHFGIMDMCGFPKNIYYYYQSWWTNEDVLHISPHWNWKEKLGQNIDVWVNTNADNVELVLNGKSLGKKDMPRNSHLNWSVKYEPGTLEAIAIKNGKPLKTKVETTNPPHSIVISPYKTTILADGKDATVLNISVVDKEGREVPDADNLIKFGINGGKIIGVGNGDPSSHEMDKCTEGSYQRALFSGKCQVIIQSNPKAGPIQFDAKANGLMSGSVVIKAQ